MTTHTDDPTTDVDNTPSSAPASSSIASVLTKVKKHFAEVQGIAPLNQIITFSTKAYLSQLDTEDPPEPAIIEQQLLALINGIVIKENAKAQGSSDMQSMKLSPLKTLTAWQTAQVMLAVHRIVKITPAGDEGNTDEEYDPLAMYQYSGWDKGTYTTSEERIRATARLYNSQLTLNEFKEVTATLRECAGRTTTCQHRDLIAVKNGIFHYGTKQAEVTIEGKEFTFEPKSLNPFDPALVFLAKCHVRYTPDAENPVLTHPLDGSTWDILSWIRELSDDEGVPELLWELIGAIIRPHVRWNKTAWFYSEKGNNGKGTLCSLMRNIVGAGAHTSIPLSDFGKEFALEPLLKCSAIIVDENDVGAFIDKAANLKSIVTGDIIQINRKHRMPIAYRFEGFMVQCLNEFPRFKDKSESNYRRQLFVPFKKWFGGGIERRYIKDDYLKRTDVLEFALWYVLNETGAETPGEYYELSEPVATQDVLAEYKEVNDPVRAFWAEFREGFAWDLLPFTFSYDLYKAWFPQVVPTGSPVSAKQFVNDLVAIVTEDPDWHCPDKNRKIRPGKPDTGLMSQPEHLIAEYNLKSWMNPTYGGSDPDKVCLPVLKPNYRGILRHSASAPAESDD